MEIRKFKKILVANRGEIAQRIFRACYDLNLRTVAIYSQEDTYSLYRTRADEAYRIGENKSPLAAYLDIPAIIDLAKRRQVDAIHPAYGFLSENAEFARACDQAGITFIGPSHTILEQMGDKLTAKTIAAACGVPTIPGSARPLTDENDAIALAEAYGYPVLLKAAGGGGGRGMRRCDSAEDIRVNFRMVKNEAQKAFGNEDIFIEKYLVEPKHIEVQVLGDQYGNIVHLFERDCSLQRRYQKALRAISEEHIHGVKTNMPFLTNILQHPAFRAGKCHTRFIDETPELFDFEEGRDRATKVLRYIAEIQVKTCPPSASSTTRRASRPMNIRRRGARASSGCLTGKARRRSSGMCWMKSACSSPTPPCATPISRCCPPACAPATC